MASQTKSVSGNTTTYTITDSAGNAMTAAATVNNITGVTVVYGGSAVRGDATEMLAQLCLLLGTGVLP